ncbi:U3 small nucleolar RNA-associated protein NOL7 isoform X1 [Nothobranchius furzeri]|uniref:Nucleolar protein 7 n=1 Tax=Nothobranchius furzeri TaxID=105023 RepID=A0A8C6PN38_NOTFU|nr:nucleolar protein 7 isoform X1 [Nothobranchius furzeri]KAF7221899.1 nucleolar protein 7 [Nothobranchius furzeri]
MSSLSNMAKKQRGKTRTGYFLKTGDVEKPTKAFALTLESSDDEAPEEVTFEDSKAQALRSLKRALDSAKREKELLKEKRRKKQELFQEQKKRKLLPVEVLEEIDSPPSEKHKQSEDGAEEEAEDRTTSVKLPNVRIFKGNYTVRAATEQTAAAAFQRQAAEDFIQSRLYGPGSCRGTNNELLSIQNKNGGKKSAAVQFVKKGWACEKKAKAEKMNKRWIHKQQIPSS